MIDVPISTSPQCPECKNEMRLAHQGQTLTTYVCQACGAALTIPVKPPERIR